MGSTGIYCPTGTAKQILWRQLTSHSESGTRWRPLKIMTKGFRRSYVAYEVSQPGQQPFVIGMVVLHQRYGDEFVYKEVSEDMGPCECDCPAAILKLLSPLEVICEPGSRSYEYAKTWRERCQAAIDRGRRQVPTGSRIRFERPIKFTDGSRWDTFIVCRRRRQTYFEVVGPLPGRYYKIRDWKRREFQVLPEEISTVAQLLAIDGTRTEVRPAGEHFTLEELQQLVGGYIEPLGLRDGRVMLIDEDGKAKRLARNPEASRLMTGQLTPGDYIVGPALLVHRDEEGHYV